MADRDELLAKIRYDTQLSVELWAEDVSLKIWNLVLANLAEQADSVEYRVDDIPVEFAGVREEYFSVDDEHARTLKMRYGDLTWSVGFLSIESIYLQGEPLEFQAVQHVDQLLNLMANVSSLSGRSVRLYREGAREVNMEPLAEVTELAR